jgi:5'-3' exoribonuclease 2
MNDYKFCFADLPDISLAQHTDISTDGVAPRAKMNQQRARRFRAAQEKEEQDEKKEEFRKMLIGSENRRGDDAEETEQPKKAWDSNVITPGTPFMRLLAQSLRYWVAYKLNTDPMWANLKVIISDATVPGEGEHKIMEFIRSQRRSQEYDPNTHHVIYGLDADLIMLALSTHEPHFRVLREDVFFQGGQPRPCKICGQVGHREQQCRGQAKKKEGEFDEKTRAPGPKPFIWLKIPVLREYLAEELNVPQQPFRFDLERAIDDWVSLCFFVGNDFLPHLPSLAIREEGIEVLVAAWRDNLPYMEGYITKDGNIHLDRVQVILQALAKQENSIFKKRKQIDDKREANFKRRKLQEEQRNGKGSNNGMSTNQQRIRRGVQEDHANYPMFNPADAGQQVRQITHDMMVNKKASFQAQIADTSTANKSAAAVLKEKLKSSTSQASLSTANENQDQDNQDTDTGNVSESPSVLGKRKADALDKNEGTPGRSTPVASSTPKGLIENPPPDTVRLWEDGYQDRYYEQKFKADPRDIEFRRKVGNAYIEGVCWVLLYYMQGCPSWSWYYPYHYAPFAEDFVDLATLDIKFDNGIPFRPYEQLMSVLPAASRHAIPELFHPLMTEEDSPIIDFYPTDFELDLNGKKFAHQGVVLLPFIDEKRLLKNMHELYDQLSDDEKTRNAVGKEYLYFSTGHPMYQELASTWYTKKQGAPKVSLKARTSLGLLGKVEKDENYMPDSGLYFPLSGVNMPDLEQDNSMR